MTLFFPETFGSRLNAYREKELYLMEILRNPFSSCRYLFSCALSSGNVLHAELALAYSEIGEGGIPLRSKSYEIGPFVRLIQRLTADQCTANNKFLRLPGIEQWRATRTIFGKFTYFPDAMLRLKMQMKLLQDLRSMRSVWYGAHDFDFIQIQPTTGLHFWLVGSGVAASTSSWNYETHTMYMRGYRM